MQAPSVILGSVRDENFKLVHSLFDPDCNQWCTLHEVALEAHVALLHFIELLQ